MTLQDGHGISVAHNPCRDGDHYHLAWGAVRARDPDGLPRRDLLQDPRVGPAGPPDASPVARIRRLNPQGSTGRGRLRRVDRLHWAADHVGASGTRRRDGAHTAACSERRGRRGAPAEHASPIRSSPRRRPPTACRSIRGTPGTSSVSDGIVRVVGVRPVGAHESPRRCRLLLSDANQYW